MKYAIYYYRGCDILPQADEIILRWDEPNENILEYLPKYKQEQRLIFDVQIDDSSALTDSLKIFGKMWEVHKNIAVRLNSTIKTHRYLAADLYDINIPFFFINGVENLDTLTSYINYGVSDVYIVNELGFSLNKVSKVCKKHNVNIRIYPNVAQHSCDMKNLPSLKMFFVRPEDISFYEPYVDIFEFYGPLNKQTPLFNIYNKGEWKAGLEHLILDYNDITPNSQIVPYFGEQRVKCGKRCVFEECSLCDQIAELAYSLKKQGYTIDIERKSIYEEEENE